MGKSYNDTESKTINLIGPGTVITGEIKAQGDMRVDGTLNGNLFSKGRVVVGNSGNVKGEITCETSEIAGKIEGKVNVAGLLSLKASSVVTGDIKTGKISIEPGAAFSGTCKMNGELPAGEKTKK